MTVGRPNTVGKIVEVSGAVIGMLPVYGTVEKIKSEAAGVWIRIRVGSPDIVGKIVEVKGAVIGTLPV